MPRFRTSYLVCLDRLYAATLADGLVCTAGGREVEQGYALTLWCVRLDPILVVPYEDAWPGAFEEHRRRLEPALAPALTRPIEHIGSTAVPGLPAKAIIDMLAVVRAVHHAAGCAGAIEATGWVAAPEPYDEAERRLSFCFPSVEHRTHHLHVVE